MRVEVDPELCISCGACIDTCPEIFDWNDEDKAVATTQDDLPEDLEDCAHEAVESCPTEAIREH
ncbi:MAG: ferredoxin [Bacillota bacterium]